MPLVAATAVGRRPYGLAVGQREVKIGMEGADTNYRKAHRRPDPEDPIRTLAFTLVAIAAVGASVALARHRHHEWQPEIEPAPERAPTTTGPDLDAIRSAGL